MVLVGLATAGLALGLNRPSQAGYLHRSHAQIVDGAGRVLQLRGVNLGNWLYREPWMIGNTGFAMYSGEDGKDDEMQAAIRDLAGNDGAAAFDKTWRDNFITQDDITAIKRLGFNSVRVPLDYRLFYDPATGDDRDDGFPYLDSLLGWCADAKIYVILDMHAVPGGKLAWVTGSIYSDPKKQQILAHVWQRIAGRYKNDSWIGGYDLVNEPAVWDAGKLVGLYKTLTKSVRAEDTHHLIFAEGDAWGSRLDLLGLNAPADIWDSNLALSDHDYGSSLPPLPGADGKYNPAALPAHKILAAHLDVPLWMGEFGYNSNSWDNTERRLCEKSDPLPAGWCLWAYKSSGVWSLTSTPIPDAYQALQAFWNARKAGQDPPRPSPAAASAALRQLALATALPSCRRNRDVVDALTRSDFPTRAVPFQTGLAIPGRIPAVAYDMGAEGVAYHDTISTDEAGKGPAGRPWNDGWSFRNDGVDIFSHPDGDSHFQIGGIQPGEWTDYTVSVQPGIYSLHIRYGSPNGGKMRVLLNGKNIGGPISLPATGGWETFGTQTVPGVKIRASGRMTLRVVFDSDGFNLDWVDFGR